MNLSEYPLWHPYTQEFLDPAPVKVLRGEGSYLITESGKKLLDGISSWWVNIHGHAHPFIAEAISKQAKTLEQVIFAGFTHEPALELANKLLEKLPAEQKKVFLSDNGSTAVEVAIKMCMQYWHNKGDSKNIFLALEDSYHGDTFGSMSVSSRSVFTKAFEKNLFEVIHLPLPTEGKEKACMETLKNLLKKHKENIAGFIFEPLLLGAGGMLVYSAEVLNEILKIIRSENILCIADEVFTGFGRTGSFMAMDQVEENADLYCFSKGITGGFMPLGVTTCRQEIYNAFLSEDRKKTFFHGHSYTANPLACAASCASFELWEKEDTLMKIQEISKKFELMKEEFKKNRNLIHIRNKGPMLAMELKTKEQTGYTNELKNKVIKYYYEEDILVRPLGNILYFLPPYCTDTKAMEKIFHTTEKFLSSEI